MYDRLVDDTGLDKAGWRAEAANKQGRRKRGKGIDADWKGRWHIVCNVEMWKATGLTLSGRNFPHCSVDHQILNALQNRLHVAAFSANAS